MSQLPGPIDHLPAVPWVRERDVDLVLADTFSSRPEFVDWLLGEHRATDAPKVVEVRAVINYNRPGSAPEAMGESDILVRACLADGTIVVLSIEDKVAADSQQAQPERHREFVSSITGAEAYSVIIAPQQWLASHPNDVSQYHIMVSLERAAEWHRRNGLAWRAELLEQACLQPTGPVVHTELSAWAASVYATLAEEFGLHLSRQELLRTPVEGRGKDGRFLNCASKTLIQVPPARRARLSLKTSTAKFEARADIKVVEPQPWFVEVLKDLAFQAELELREGKNGHLVTKAVPSARAWTTTKPVAEQLPELRALGQAAKDLAEWWNEAVVQAVRSRA